MGPLVYMMLLGVSACLAHYRLDFVSRNMIEREEPQDTEDGYPLVECPVCEIHKEHWMYQEERCDYALGNKRYKKCMYDTYTNEACGNRLDCYRGPDEHCVESINSGYEIRCAPGYVCLSNKCRGISSDVDNRQAKINAFVLPERWPVARRNLIARN